MCGRYILSSPADTVADFFDLPDFPALEPRYNIAPTQEAPIVRSSDEAGGRYAAFARWGLVPSWAEDPAIGNRMINARSESVRSRPSFRDSFRERRCLVPADGFYEWLRRDSVRQPHLFSPVDAPLLAFAGLWDRWTRNEHSFESFTLLTTQANSTVLPIHGRMTVILPREVHDSWLDPDNHDLRQLASLLRPYPAQGIESNPVSTYVNNPANEGTRCLSRDLTDTEAGSMIFSNNSAQQKVLRFPGPKGGL